jgi:predicted Zn-dependent peptidase
MSQAVTDRTKAPKIVIPETVNIAKANKHYLTNGKAIHIIEQGLPELVRFEAIFDAGSVKDQNPILPDITNAMLDEGTERHSSKELAEKLDFLAANLNLNVGKHTASLTVHSLKKHFAEVMELLVEMMTRPKFSENELNIVRQHQYQNYLIRRENTDKLASDRFWEVIFGENHPYGISVKAEDYLKMQPDNLLRFHKEHYRPEEALFLFSGRPDASVNKILEKNLKPFKPVDSGSFSFNNTDIRPSKQMQHRVHKKDAVQASLRMGKATINKHHPDYIKLNIVNVLLGGYFGSRLMANIREDKGYTYGIYSSLGSLFASGYFLISAETQHKSVNAAAEEIRNELRKLRTELVSEEELTIVKHYLLGSLLENFDGTDATARSFKSVYFYGLDESWFLKYISELKKITPDEIRETAQKYLQEDSMYEVICADTKAV